MPRLARSVLAAALVTLFAACSGASSSAPSAPTAPTSTSAADGQASLEDFCGLAVRATNGELDFTNPDEVRQLTEHAALGVTGRQMVKAATNDAERQLANGDYSNEQLVSTVNALCDLDLTPVTMQP